MTDLRQAAEQALEALEYHVEQTRPIWKTSEAIAALQSALQEPVEKTTGNLVHIKLNIMRTALENIVGIRQVMDNLLSDKDIARIALERINTYEQRKN